MKKEKNMKSIFTKEQIKYMCDNYDKMSYREIGEVLGFSERQIRSKINSMQLTKRRKFNSDYFNSINSPNQAYWLGFIYADGYLLDNPDTATYELGIELIDTDKYILQKLNQELGNQHEIYHKHSHKKFNGYEYETDSCVLRVYSKKIVRDLEKLNVYPNKTYRAEFPQCNNDFFFDFLRGFCDGDGCIYIDKQNKIFVNFTNANKDFLEYLSNAVCDRINVQGRIYKEKDKKYRLYYCNKSDVKLLLDNMYSQNTSCRLERKYNKYKSYYGFAS